MELANEMEKQSSHTSAGRSMRPSCQSQPKSVSTLPSLKKEIIKMPNARLKKKTMTRTDKYRLLSRFTLWQKNKKARCPNNVSYEKP